MKRKRKYRIIIAFLALVLVIFGSGITYSLFRGGATLSANQGIAKFIFNAEKSDSLELPISDMNPGDSNEYAFSVSNNNEGSTSNVDLAYELTIETYHFVPLLIELYKINGEEQQLIMTCDETYTRNSSNELICNTPTQEMSNESEILDNYNLKISFPEEYNGSEYADLVDYMNIEIRSWQKINEE